MCSFVYNKTTFYLPSRKNGDERFALSDSEGGVSRSLSVDPDQSRAATLFEKLDGAIKKKQSAFLNQPNQVGRLAGAELSSL